MRRKPNVLRVSAVVATVTVAAACGDGGTATGPSNRSPAASGTMPAQTVTVGETATLTVSSYFRDPDGDALSYGAETSDAAVATVSVSGSTLTVIGVTAAATTVTVTASDPEGLSASQSFEVTVLNRPPEAVDKIPDLTVTAGGTESVDASSYFRDPDGDALSYGAETSDAAVATVSVSGSTLTVIGVTAAATTVTVTASDPEGLSASQSFEVTVLNRPPEAVDKIPDLTVTAGGTESVDASSYFRDPDGDALSYGAETSDAAVATVSVSGSTLTVIGVTAGATTVTVTASDPEGLSASQIFEVTAQEPVALAVPAAYLTQAAQDLDSDVPLIAGRQALLRVFGTADDYLTPTGKGLATFFVRGQEVYRAPLEPPTPNIPLDVDESRLDRSFNARIPEHVLQPGLEMVAELDPDRTLPLNPGSRSRFPASGRFAVDVREVPPMHLTFVPVLYHTETEGATATNSQVENAARDLATEDSRGELRYTRDILPIGDLSVKLREPHYTSANTSGGGSGQILRELSMLRHLEAAEGEYYHGLFAVPEQQHPNWPAGVADPSGHVAISEVFQDFVQRRIIAHELGHNLSLSHAPCGTTGDPAFPYADGSIGIWGHRFIRGDATGFGELFPPEYTDIMSYCFPQWISDYHFSKALRFRSASAVATSRQTAVASTATLLLWGGTHDGDLRLEPAFVLDARVKIPEASGPYDVTGLDDEGRRLFSVSFTPDELDHGGSSFLFAIPFEAEWTEDLDRVTLTGPEGSTTLDRDTGGRAALIVDRASGRIRTIARDWYDGALPAAVPPNAQVEIIRGLPSR